MTEAEWRSSADPEPMLTHLAGGSAVSDRKLRLFALACCRRVWNAVPEVEEGFKTPAEAADAAEAFAASADGHVTDRERKELLIGLAAATAAHAAASRADPAEAAGYAAAAVYATTCLTGFGYADGPAKAWSVVGEAGLIEDDALDPDERTHQADLLRDVFGNPLHPVALDPSCLTPAVVSLARTIHDERRFDRVPELADALERAGCTNADILDHCRGPGPHVRGCWVVDLLLGKA